MNRLSKFAAGLLAFSLTVQNAAPSQADTYKIDLSHTAIIFGISHLNYSYTYGRFNRASGAYVLDGANPAANQFQLAIDAASIDTNDPKRDGHLRNADFFNVKQFPVISFQSTSVKPLQAPRADGATHDVTGNFTMHGVTKEIVLPMRKMGEGLGPYGKYRTGFYCQTTLKRSDFGMTNMIPNIGDEVAITISFEGLRQDAAGAGSGSTSAPVTAPAAQPAGSGSGSSTQGSSGKR